MGQEKREPQPGDRVCAPQRVNFPTGEVVKLLGDGFVLVRWNGGLLETARAEELELVGDNGR